jgi:hypothetical protein
MGWTPCAASPTSATRGATNRSASDSDNGIGEPLSGQGNRPQEIAEARAQRRQIGVVVQRLDGGGGGVGLAPDDAGMMPSGQRQDRQRTRGHEELVRRALVVLLVGTRLPARSGHSPSPAAGCPPAPPRPTRARRSRPATAPQVSRPEASVTVTPCDPASCATTVSPDSSVIPGSARIAARKAAYRCRSSSMKPIGPSSISAANRRPGRTAPRLRPPCRREALIRRIGCTLSATAGQMPIAVKQPHRGDGQRIGAPVEPRFGPVGAGRASITVTLKPTLRQGQGQGRAVQPAARDQDVGIMLHAPWLGAGRAIVHGATCRYRRAGVFRG